MRNAPREWRHRQPASTPPRGTGLLDALAIVLCGVLAAGCSTTGPEGGGGDSDLPATLGLVGSIEGHVTQGGSPASMVTIVAEPSFATPVAAVGDRYTGSTDADGAFLLESVPPGVYNVSASVAGQAGIQPGVQVMPRAATQVNIDVVPVGAVTGKVALGAATGNAGIAVWLAGTSVTAFTGDNGAFSMTGVPVGTYTVLATTAGYSVEQASGQVVAAGATRTVPDMTLALTSNHIPSIETLTSDPIQVQQAGSVTIDAEAADSDGDPLTYAWTAASGVLSGSGSSVQWVAPGSDGSYAITLVVSDDRGGAVAGAVTILVSTDEPPNSAPSLTAIALAPGGPYAGGLAVSAQVTGTDSDGDTLSYVWSATGGSFGGSGRSVTWTSPRASGTYTIACVVNDGRGGMAQRSASVTVNADNEAPTISNISPAPGSDCEPGTAIAVSVTATDPDGDPRSYVWSATGGSFTGSGASVTWTAPQVAGTCTITCVVTDGRGGMAQASTNVTVSATSVVIW